MKKSWLYGLSVLCFFYGAENTQAVSINDISFLKGKEIIFSSPYEDADKAIHLNTDDISLSESFYDDGEIIFNQKAYPIDQLFVRNNEGQYENLASVLKYDGIATTYFIRYYDKDRLALSDEIHKLKQQAKNCVGIYEKGGTEAIAEQAQKFGHCLDEVFYRSVHLFYSQSEESMIKDYQEQCTLWTRFYFAIENPDNCYGKCGTVAQMRAYGKVVEAKQKFILDLLNNQSLSINEY